MPRQSDEHGGSGDGTGAWRKQNGNTKGENGAKRETKTGKKREKKREKKGEKMEVGNIDAEGKNKKQTCGRLYCSVYLTKFDRKNFLLCRHVEAISDLLFSSVRLSALAISSFSVRQRSHLPNSHVNPRARRAILHVIV